MAEDRVIEHFFSAHSAYAYLGAWELQRIADEAGWTIHHRPVDLNPVIAATSGKSFGGRSAAHQEYFFGRDMFRWAEWRELPMIRIRPTYHDNPLALPNGCIIAAGKRAGAVARAIMLAHWRDDADIADAGTLRGLVEGEGLDADAILDAAAGETVQAEHQANTEEAIARNIFGSPTYFVRGDMFYGQDRLAMVERAIAKPFAP